MKIGINLINFGPGVSPESLARSADLAESLGYHLVMISDHVAITADVQQRYPAPFYDPFTALAWLAARTRRIELGTTVIIVPYRHPLQTARVAANIDQLSGGRLILGVGVGWARQEFDALGVPFSKRGAITNDYLAAIKTAWTHEIASHHGPFVSFHDVRTGPKPVQSPHPRIWVGGASDAALRRAVLHGQGWHPIRIRTAWLETIGMPRLRAISEELGKPVPALCPRIKLRITESPVADDQRVAGEGTLTQIRADLLSLEALGAAYVLLDTYADVPEDTRHPEIAWRVLTTLAEQVLDLPRSTLR